MGLVPSLQHLRSLPLLCQKAQDARPEERTKAQPIRENASMPPDMKEIAIPSTRPPAPLPTSREPRRIPSAIGGRTRSRATSAVRVDPSVTVQNGMRANENA